MRQNSQPYTQEAVGRMNPSLAFPSSGMNYSGAQKNPCSMQKIPDHFLIVLSISRNLQEEIRNSTAEHYICQEKEISPSPPFTEWQKTPVSVSPLLTEEILCVKNHFVSTGTTSNQAHRGVYSELSKLLAPKATSLCSISRCCGFEPFTATLEGPTTFKTII